MPGSASPPSRRMFVLEPFSVVSTVAALSVGLMLDDTCERISDYFGCTSWLVEARVQPDKLFIMGPQLRPPQHTTRSIIAAAGQLAGQFKGHGIIIA